MYDKSASVNFLEMRWGDKQMFFHPNQPSKLLGCFENRKIRYFLFMDEFLILINCFPSDLNKPANRFARETPYLSVFSRKFLFLIVHQHILLTAPFACMSAFT